MNRVKRHKVVQPRNESIRLIPLTRGFNTIVDADDYEFLIQWNWHVHESRGKFYARNHTILMHRVLTNNKKDTDHYNGDTLDNRRNNLRPCTKSQNGANQHKHHDNTSGYKGVTKHGKKWQAKIGVHKRKIHLGTFPTAKKAAAAYAIAAKKHFGKFAKT